MRKTQQGDGEQDDGEQGGGKPGPYHTRGRRLAYGRGRACSRPAPRRPIPNLWFRPLETTL